VQENSGSVGAGLFETWVDHSKQSYSNQVSLEWMIEVAVVEAVLNSR